MPTHAHTPGAAAPLTVRRMRAKDAEQVTRVWHGAWLDAYVRPGGVPTQWVDTYWEDRLTPRGVARLAERAERSGRAGITGGGGRELSYLVASQGLYEGVLPEITMRREARCGLSHESEGRG